MAKTMNVTLLAVLVIAAATVLPGTQAADFTVGDTTGWQVPTSGGDSFYTNWAANKNFSVGDILVFNFANGVHDVATVTKDAFDACTIANPINQINTGPANITLAAAGDHYFICTIGTHCTGGQKLTVNVLSSNGPATSPPPPAGSTPPPPPSPSGAAASSLAATLPLILMTVASAIFYDLF